MAPPKKGDKILIYQYSLFEKKAILTQGYISKCIKYQDKCVIYQLDAFCYSGSSGAPILNTNGDIIGIVYENISFGNGVQIPNLSFGISYEIIKDIIENKDNIEKLRNLYWFKVEKCVIEQIFCFLPKSYL